MIAFVDESIRNVTEDGVGTYVVGCVVIPHAEEAQTRQAVLRRGPFRWNSADEESRLSMLRWIGGTRLLAAAYAYRGLLVLGREGARQACLKWMLHDFGEWEIEELIIETRRPLENTRDACTIIHAVQAGYAPAGLKYAWGTKSEPLLRMPDAVAGAVRANYEAPPDYTATLTRMGAVIRSVP